MVRSIGRLAREGKASGELLVLVALLARGSLSVPGYWRPILAEVRRLPDALSARLKA
ncbi:MAG: hypothetical protein J0L91_06970 [Burkholderiales bacterium]|nr:hypothetical protein [Burkholderiales bacterium]MCC7115109.1 hypothetical protein [Burkholderiales bacterium]